MLNDEQKEKVNGKKALNDELVQLEADLVNYRDTRKVEQKKAAEQESRRNKELK